MANEAICIEAPKTIVRRTIADATATPKGTVMRLSGANAVFNSHVSGTALPFGGIAVEEKVTGDGITEIGCAIDGVWDMKNGNVAIATGKQVVMSGANMIEVAEAADLLNGAIIGILEETATASDTVRVRLGGQA